MIFGTQWLRLSVLLCLVLGVLFLPSTSPRVALAEIPPPAEAHAEASEMQGPATSDAPAAALTVGSPPCTYATIAAAVAAADPGDQLLIQGGATFNENVIIDKNLTLEGGYTRCTGGTTEPATINAGGSGRGVSVTSSKVTLRDLQITGGNAALGGGLYATNGAVIILESVEVTANTGYYGGGIYVSSGTEVALTQGSPVHHNVALIAGGGVRVQGRLMATDTYSDISDNSAPHGGGASVSGGVLHLIEADMRGNRATDPAGMGGAILLQQGAVVTMTGNAWLTNGNQAADGAGIYADASEVFLGGATLGGNVASDRGGGLVLANGSALSASGAVVGFGVYPYGNEARLGAGIYADDSTVDFSGRIYNNRAAVHGGGLLAISSIITLTDADVGGTGLNEGNRVADGGYRGGGLYLLAGTHATLQNTVVSSNLLSNPSSGSGGGLYVSDSSVVTLTNSRVESHVLPATADGHGAGIFMAHSTVTLDNSAVLSNTAGIAGGGIRVWESGVLTIMNGSVLRNNHALDGEGGAVAATAELDGTPELNISDAVLRDNTAGTDGGAIYLDAGALDFTGGWTLRKNTAGGNGGAVAVFGSATAAFAADAYSLAYDNVADTGHGGLLYLGNNTTTQLRATSGSQLYVYANRAIGNGGALYANGGGLFDVYGQVNFDRNRADNGGAVYLSNGSRLWLDDDATTRPQLWDNRADHGSGGAIYAVDSPRVECDGATFGKAGEGNQASESGGAIYLSSSNLDADNCIFQENRAGEHGGAIAAQASTLVIHATYPGVASATERAEGGAPLDGPSILATPRDPNAEPCSVFSGNVADAEADYNGCGGAIWNHDGTLTINHTYLNDNHAAIGGAIYQRGLSASAEVANTLIHGNSVAPGFPGAGIRLYQGAFTLNHVTLANNVGGHGFSGVATEVRNTIAWGNDGFPGFEDVPLTVSCNLDDGGNAGPMIDPQFVDPGAGEDYPLRATSPAIDACATGLSPDLLNRPRPLSDAYDMGAFETEVYAVYLPLTLR